MYVMRPRTEGCPPPAQGEAASVHGSEAPADITFDVSPAPSAATLDAPAEPMPTPMVARFLENAPETPKSTAPETAELIANPACVPMPAAVATALAAAEPERAAKPLLAVAADTLKGAAPGGTEPSAAPASHRPESRMTADGLLSIVLDSLASAPPEASPSDCRALIVSALRLSHPRFCLRLQHLHGAATANGTADPASGGHDRGEEGAA